MAKLSKSDWLEEGFKILSEFAQDKLRIAYLCERLHVTRGSFYHHFESIENYTDELLQEWERKNTLNLIKNAGKGGSPWEKMQILAEEIAQASQTVEAAIRSWSFYKPLIKSYLEKVDDIRLGYLRQLFEDMGLERNLAHRRAQIDYAVLVGLQQLYPNISKREMEELWRVYVEMLPEHN